MEGDAAPDGRFHEQLLSAVVAIAETPDMGKHKKQTGSFAGTCAVELDKARVSKF